MERERNSWLPLMLPWLRLQTVLRRPSWWRPWPLHSHRLPPPLQPH